MITRRGILRAGLVAGAGVLLPLGCAGRRPEEGATLERFRDALPVPRALDPVGRIGGITRYRVPMTQFRQQLHSELPPTTLWGYGGTYPGPTIEAQRGERIAVTWMNRLPPGHHLPVDPCLHGPHGYDDRDAPRPKPRAVVHLHGGHVPPESDGYPEATLLPGQDVTYEYPNRQRAATLWYHDHALGITRLNVYMGLAGAYLIREPVERDLNLPRGEFEVPLLIQDRSFEEDGSLDYPKRWEEEFFGETILVNGRVWPYLEVKPRRYRFRIFNGSNSRTLQLALDSGQPFYQIGTDGGLLPAPVEVREITLAPAERADAIVDFSRRAGELTLTNRAPAPFPGTPGKGVIREVMQFRVRGSAAEDSSLPARLEPLASLPEETTAPSRDFILDMVHEDPRCTKPGFRWRINGLGWDDITEYPRLATAEIWRFYNLSADLHPMHLHLVHFRILDRQALLPDPAREGFFLRRTDPASVPVPPDPSEAGWKDTFRSNPGEVTRIIARFEDFTGRYPYHCHILELEDHEMMRQFEVVP
jgi:spore coat protein A